MQWQTLTVPCARLKTLNNNVNPPNVLIVCCMLWLSTGTHTVNAITTHAFVLLLNLAPSQHASCCGSHLKVFFKSLYFITWSSRVMAEPDRSLLSLTVRFTTFSSRSVPVDASTITPLAVLTLQLERGDVVQPLCLGAQQDIYRVDIL